MPEKKERYGAFIVPPRKNWIFQGHGTYTIYIGKEDDKLKKGTMFTTNPQISRIIEEIFKKQQLQQKTEIGYIQATTPGIFGKKIVRLGTYYPFGATTTKILRGKGLASRIELRILQDLKKKFPKCKVITQQSTALFPRRQMLQKRESWQNRTIAMPVEFEAEIGKIAKYIGSHSPSNRKQAHKKPL